MIEIISLVTRAVTKKFTKRFSRPRSSSKRTVNSQRKIEVFKSSLKINKILRESLSKHNNRFRMTIFSKVELICTLISKLSRYSKYRKMDTLISGKTASQSILRGRRRMGNSRR